MGLTCRLTNKRVVHKYKEAANLVQLNQEFVNNKASKYTKRTLVQKGKAQSGNQLGYIKEGHGLRLDQRVLISPHPNRNAWDGHSEDGSHRSQLFLLLPAPQQAPAGLQGLSISPSHSIDFSFVGSSVQLFYFSNFHFYSAWIFI